MNSRYLLVYCASVSITILVVSLVVLHFHCYSLPVGHLTGVAAVLLCIFAVAVAPRSVLEQGAFGAAVMLPVCFLLSTYALLPFSKNEVPIRLFAHFLSDEIYVSVYLAVSCAVGAASAKLRRLPFVSRLALMWAGIGILACIAGLVVVKTMLPPWVSTSD